MTLARISKNNRRKGRHDELIESAVPQLLHGINVPHYTFSAGNGASDQRCKVSCKLYNVKDRLLKNG